jgi:pectin methylesterase-like acyl-CoA thioesterase
MFQVHTVYYIINSHSEKVGNYFGFLIADCRFTPHPENLMAAKPPRFSTRPTRGQEKQDESNKIKFKII